MPFEVKNKVVAITGGAQGIGLAIVRVLLESKVRGLTIIDIDAKVGTETATKLEKEFSGSRVIFAKADVRNVEELEEAFKKTVNEFKNLDIFINNAGIVNDARWADEIAINVTGVVNGTILAMETYLPKYKTGNEGVIVNVASIAGTTPFAEFPIYCASKHGVIGLTRAFGQPSIYEKNKVRVVAICPGFTNTPLVHHNLKGLNDFYQKAVEKLLQRINDDHIPLQPPESVARALQRVIEKGPNGTIWISEEQNKTYQFVIPSRDTMKKDYIENM